MGPTAWRRRSTIAFSDRSVRFRTDSRLDGIRGDCRLVQRRGAVRDVQIVTSGRRSHKLISWGQCAENGEYTSPFSGASPVSGEGTVPAHLKTEYRPRRFQPKTLLCLALSVVRRRNGKMVLRNQTGPSQSSIACSTSTPPTSFRMSEGTWVRPTTKHWNVRAVRLSTTPMQQRSRFGSGARWLGGPIANQPKFVQTQCVS